MEKFERFKLVVTVAGLVIVPATAFLIRMFEGDTKNDAEVIISRALKDAWASVNKRLKEEE